MLTAYHDDYPHGKFYVACQDQFPDNLDLKAQECPLEGLKDGVSSFAKLDFPDNFFDIVTAGSVVCLCTK
jgi:hypothetical protein